MRESKASRTLLKSPPELWSEVSTATSLQRHMDHFGEIRITKLEHETAVAWEGEHARGTITLEVSGWGTKVSLTAEPTGSGAIDATKPDTAGRAEPESATHLAEPIAAPEPATARERERVGAAARVPERAGAAAREPEPAGAAEPRREPAYAAEPRASVSSPDAARPEVPDRITSPQQDRLDASIERPRWTRRVAEKFRKWFSPPLGEDANTPTNAPEPRTPEPEPEQQAVQSTPIAQSTPAAREFHRVVAPPTPPERAEPSPQQEPALEIDEASTAALDATLDSLGQAHHRPFSRA